MFQLTEEQEQSKNYLITKIKESTPYLVLKGNAGTGKSTVIQHLVKDLKDQNLKVVIAAPTNKAVKVLRGMAKKFGVAVNISTIHSLLGIFPKIKETIDEDGNVIQIEVFEIDRDGRESSLLEGLNVLIIDEASMISKELFTMIQETCESSGISVVFVGDPAQLPPINETESLTLKLRNQVKLTKLIRQAESNPVIQVLTHIRNNLDQRDIFIQSNYNKQEKSGVIVISSYEQLISAIYEYFEGFQKNPDKIRILSWTRNCVAQYNDIVRKFLYPSDYKQRFIVGEILIANSPYYKSIVGDQGKVSKIAVLENSEEVEITYVSEYHDSAGFKTWSLKTRNIIDGSEKEVIVLHEDDTIRFKQHLDHLVEQAKSDPSKKHLWKQFYSLKERYADVGYAYSLTTHKSQGSTFENVIVIRSDILKNPKVVERNQCMYVAISRCQKLAMLY
jgi:exodeoxyribonuclease-5